MKTRRASVRACILDNENTIPNSVILGAWGGALNPVERNLCTSNDCVSRRIQYCSVSNGMSVHRRDRKLIMDTDQKADERLNNPPRRCILEPLVVQTGMEDSQEDPWQCF